MGYVAKSVILDIADSWISTGHIGIRSIDFWLGGSKVTVLAADITCYATTTYNSYHLPKYAFDTSTSKVGETYYSDWMSGVSVVTNQRLICVFNTPIEFDSIVVNNFHDEGYNPQMGARNVKILLSSNAITSTVYNQAVANSTVIYDGAFSQHTASDVEDPQTLSIVPYMANDLRITIPVIDFAIYPYNNIVLRLPVLDGSFESSTNISVGFTATIPPLFLTSAASASQTLDSFNMDLPMLGMDIRGPSNIVIKTPSLSIDIKGNTSRLANLKTTIPMLVMASASGSSIASDLPSLDIAIGAVVEIISDISALIPSLTMQIADNGHRTGSFAISIPVLHMASNLINGVVVNLKGNMPVPYFNSHANMGQVGDINLLIPMLQFRSTDLYGRIDLLVPALQLGIVSGDGVSVVGSEVLRYIRGAVR